MPNLTPMEMTVLAASVMIFLILPGILGWLDERRQRAAQTAAAGTWPLAELAAPPPETPGEPSELVQQFVSPGENSAESVLPFAGESDQPPPVGAAATGGPREPLVSADLAPPAPEPAASEPAAPEPVAPEPEAAEIEPALTSLADLFPDPPATPAGEQHFRLEDLRHATALEAPSADFDSAERSEWWRRGHEIAKRHAAEIAACELTAAAAPAAACYAGAAPWGPAFRLRYLLFAELWPAVTNQANAAAIFEVNPETGSVRGWVG